jgi:hypothetical protein
LSRQGQERSNPFSFRKLLGIKRKSTVSRQATAPVPRLAVETVVRPPSANAAFSTQAISRTPESAVEETVRPAQATGAPIAENVANEPRDLWQAAVKEIPEEDRELLNVQKTKDGITISVMNNVIKTAEKLSKGDNPDNPDSPDSHDQDGKKLANAIKEAANITIKYVSRY